MIIVIFVIGIRALSGHVPGTELHYALFVRTYAYDKPPPRTGARIPVVYVTARGDAADRWHVQSHCLIEICTPKYPESRLRGCVTTLRVFSEKATLISSNQSQLRSRILLYLYTDRTSLRNSEETLRSWFPNAFDGVGIYRGWVS